MPLTATILDVRPVVATGYHNAFGGLCHWRNHTYLAYREAQGHGIVPSGHVVIQRSADLATWTPVARLATGGDDRDPHLVADPDRLWCYFATYYPRWGTSDRTLTNTVHDLISHVALTHDGTAWSVPMQVFRPNYWLWSTVTLPVGDEQVWYGAAYHTGDSYDGVHSVHLLRSEERVWWSHRASMLLDYRLGKQAPSEPCLYVPGTDRLACVVRLEDGMMHGEARYPYTQWSWQQLATTVHAPSLVEVGGHYLLAGRGKRRDLPGYQAPAKKAKRATGGGLFSRSHTDWREQLEEEAQDGMERYCTALWELHPDEEPVRLTPLLVLPSWGDNSYPSLVYDAARQELLCAYYSQHARHPLPKGTPVAADMFLARLRLEGL